MSSAKGARALALVKALPGSSVPTRTPAAEPADVAKAYKAALGTAHLLTAGELCERLGVDPRTGLAFGEAAARVEKYGQNSAGACEAVLAGTEAWASQRHLQTVTVLRSNEAIGVTPNTLVVGDIVYLEEGEHVPADLRILAAETIVAPQVREEGARADEGRKEERGAELYRSGRARPPWIARALASRDTHARWPRLTARASVFNQAAGDCRLHVSLFSSPHLPPPLSP